MRKSRTWWLARDKSGSDLYNLSSRMMQADDGEFDPGGNAFFAWLCPTDFERVFGKVLKPGEQKRVKLTLEVIE